MQFDTKGNLIVFVLTDNYAILGVCEDLETCKKQVEVFKKFGYSADVTVSKFKVKKLTDFN